MRQTPPSAEDARYSDDTGQNKEKHRLKSAKISERLNQIDRIRANGVGDHIALPQLAVCGDQSTGKSSVLEGISGYPFPRRDGLCTQFPTEIVLRHDSCESKMAASLLPCASRSPEEKERFAAFHREFQDLSDLPDIIHEASSLLGVRGFSEFTNAPAFAADVLRLELVGNTGLHLTLVDLPGLISVSEDNKDLEMIGDVVDSYLKSSRTIILAVISASSDAETQPIIQRARHFDQDGVRTIGIITKPDLINKGTEDRVARLAKNLDRTSLNLGFFLLKNPSPSELARGMSYTQRRAAELEFFSSESWRAQGLDPTRIGIDNLRSFLAELLDGHIERELPNVKEEVRRLLKRVRDEVFDLGIERSHPSQIRIFLTRISTEFHYIVKNGLEGNYDGRDREFFLTSSSGTSDRLRAVIHEENERFSDYMRNHGQRRKVISKDDGKTFAEWHSQEPEDPEPENSENEEDKELSITKKQMSSWIKEVR